jgi:hypothetical protein
MITIQDEQEHYCLVTDGEFWTVVERRAGKYHPIGDCSTPGVALDSSEATALFDGGRRLRERNARRLLVSVASEWRNLFELIR